MRNLVAGIVLVGLATLAFNLYMRGDSNSAPMIGQVRPSGPTAQTVPSQLESDVEAFSITITESADPRPKTAVRSRSVSRAEKAISPRKLALVRKDAPAAFADTVIYYNVPARKEPTIAAVAPQRAVVRSRKKRSVFAKTFNVVKKPYDWVKHVVTQL